MLEALEPDPSLREEVLGLLAALEAEQLASARAQEKRSAPPLPLPPAIGPYRVESVLGQGGVGTVYGVTREVHGERQPLALKVLHQTMSGEEAQARFRREQQILARLVHPSIIRWLDSGFTPEGQPFLVMERVEGAPIDDFVKSRQLSPDAIVRLMLEVCEAVAEAHRNLVLHLDLKPSNIFVNTQGHAKLLDFGTAKLLDPGTTWTTTRQLTPLYASPEQLRGDALNTASDVYALGIILYELLTGSWPFGEKGSFLSVAGRLDGSLTLKRVRGRIYGDLAVILEKAMASEPAQRYRTVNDFSEDLRRHLAGRPILARRQTFSYRAAKYVRRNLGAVLVIAAMSLGLVAASVYSFGQFRKADHERRRAVAVNRFLEDMLANADPLQQTSARAAGVNLRVVDLLDAALLTVDSLDRSEPAVAAAVRASIAAGFRGVGAYDKAEGQARLAAKLAQANFGIESWEYLQALEALALTKKAASHYAEAAPLQQQLIALYEKIAPHHEGYERALSGYAGTLVYLARKKEALDFAEKALRVTEARTGELEPRAYSISQLAFVYNSLNRTEDYLRLNEQALALRRSLPVPTTNLGATLNNLAHAYYRVKNYPRALDLQQEAVTFYRARLGNDHPAVMQTLVTLAVFQDRAGRREDAVATAASAAVLADKLFPGDHKDRAYAHTVKGNLACADETTRPQAIEELRSALAMRQRVLGRNHGEVMGGNWNLALCLGRAGQAEAALAHLEETFRICREEGYPPEDIKETVEKYVEFLAALGRATPYDDVLRDLNEKYPAKP